MDVKRPVTIDLSENAVVVLKKRYLKKNEKGEPVEEPIDMFRRVADNIAEGEFRFKEGEEARALYEESRERFLQIMLSRKFMPNSPTLMNAGRELQQLSACFVLPVEDDLASIYDTLKHQALVHKSGGGCVASDAHVHTTFCGVERIETFYECVRDLGAPEVSRENHEVMDVERFGIRTLALDASTGRFEPKRITHLWRWHVPEDQQYTVRCTDGSEATTSAWHPFMVFTPDGIVERRADHLRPGDILITPNSSARDSWPFCDYPKVHGFTVDEELAWLVGYFLGDGGLAIARNRSTGYEALRLRFFDGRHDAIRFAAEILAKHGIGVTPHQDRRGLWTLTTTDSGFVPAFARLAGVEAGPKTDLTLPEWVGKSPLPVIGAFLSGLIDSDCEVSVDRRRVVLSTASPRLAHRLVSLLSVLGLDPSTQHKRPNGRAKSTEYRVKLAAAKKGRALADLVTPWVHDSFRRERLEALRADVGHGTHARIPLPFEALADLLVAAGVEVNRTAIHRTSVDVAGERFCLHQCKRGMGIGEDKLRRLAGALRKVLPPGYSDRLEQLEQLAEGWTVVASVEPAEEASAFYDFTVEGSNNYLAGGGPGKMMVIHNTGFSFSRLRPKGDIVRSTMGISSGPVSFMSVFDHSTEHIRQGGFRRGANMGILACWHPDIEEFITCKRDNDQINNFNISVAITDAFMEAVDKDTDFDLVNPRNLSAARTVRARDLFAKIVEGAWLNGEPGVVFIDKINADNPTPHFEIESTNPCSEAHLPPYDSCNLGSVNVERFVAEDGAGSGRGVDWPSLGETVRTAVRFLDNVIEMNDYPLPEIEEMSKGNRRIGLGLMGFADALLRLGIPYDSPRGVAFAEELMHFIDEKAWEASRELAAERGVFPHYEGSRHEARGDRVRNATVTTIAPTGTISIIAGCSGSIEPLFALAFMRRQADMELPDVNPEFVKLAKERGFYSDELMRKVAASGGVRDIPEVPEDVRRVWVTSHDITPEWHVRMQAAFQKYTSMGISKTINLPSEATVKDVEDAYRLAYSLNCKGIAVYRDGSRDAQVLSTGKTGANDGAEGAPAQCPPTLAEARDGRPRTLGGVTKKLTTGHGPLYVTFNDDEFGPRECFVILGKPGGTAAAFSDALGRMISLAEKHGATPQEIVHQLAGIQDGHPAGVGPNAVLSVPDGVAKAMAEHYLSAEASSESQLSLPIVGACPECGGSLVAESGCSVCHACGFSRCS
jgi:ribonucleoside-diphosphate reductase alpha chain